MQNEEQFAALFELIFKFGNCHHKIVITKMSALFFLTTVKRPSGIFSNPCWSKLNIFFQAQRTPQTIREEGSSPHVGVTRTNTYKDPEGNEDNDC